MLRSLLVAPLRSMTVGVIQPLLSSFVSSLSLLSVALPPELTFSRASVATDVIAGSLTSFSSNAPRISVENGLLQESASTNLVKNSSCVATVGTLTGGQADPLGDTAAFLYTATATTTGQQWSVGTATVAYVYNHVYTASAYVKAGTFDRVQMFLSATIVPSGTGYANFYLNGAGSVSASGASVLNPGIEKLGATDWYRIWFSFTSNTTTNHTLAFCKLITGSETRAPSVAGASQTMYFYGAQVEDAKNVSSLIPTTTTTVQRLVDSVTLPITGYFNIAVFEACTPKTHNTAVSPILARFTSGNVLMEILKDGATSEIILKSTNLGTTISLASGVVVATGTVFRVAVSLASGKYGISVDGHTQVATTGAKMDSESLTLGPSWGGYVRSVDLIHDPNGWEALGLYSLNPTYLATSSNLGEYLTNDDAGSFNYTWKD